MALFSGLFRRSTSFAAGNPANPSYWLQRAFGGMPSSTGLSLSTEGSLRVTAVFACVRVISQTIGTLPLILYSRDKSGNKERATAHPTYRLLHDMANPEMTSAAFRKALQAYVEMWGNGYARIVRDPNTGRPLELWPMRPDQVRVDRTATGALVYDYRPPQGERRVLFADEVFHVRGMTLDGINGLSPIGYARETAPLAAITEEYAAKFFSNNGRPGGVLTYPGRLDKDAATRLKDDWNAMHAGAGNAHRVAVLEDGLKWESIGIPNTDLQFIELRKFQVVEIARLFGVPPHMIGDLERSTYSNIEHQGLEFVTHAIQPRAVEWEQEIAAKLLPESERGGYFAEFLMAALTRGDLQSRYQAYATGRNWGWLSANDVRDLENLNRIEDGDLYLSPLFMGPSDVVGNPPPAAPRSLPIAYRATGGETRASGSADTRAAIAKRARRVFADAAGRLLKRETDAVRAAAERWLGSRDIGEFSQWLDTFYGPDWSETVERAYTPAVMELAENITADAASEAGAPAEWTSEDEKFARAYARQLAESQAGRSRDQLKALLTAVVVSEALDAINQRLSEWQQTRAERVAARETTKLANSATLDRWDRAGVRTVRWVTRGENCNYCAGLAGKVIGIRDSFLSADEDYKPEGASSPLRPRTRIRHAPAHAGCNCGIAIGG